MSNKISLPRTHGQTSPKSTSPKQSSLQTFLLPVDRAVFLQQLHSTSHGLNYTSEAYVAARRATAVTEGNKERQRKRRNKVKEEEIATGQRDINTGKRIKTGVLRPPIDHGSQDGIFSARASNPVRPKRKRTTASTPLEADGSHSSLLQRHKKPRSRTNWQHPLLWPSIDAAARKHGFLSPQAIVNELQKRYSAEGTFQRLTRSTVDTWIEKGLDKRRWTLEVLARVEVRSCWIAGCGKPTVLDSQPAMVSDIKEALQGIRGAGLPVNASIARDIILGFMAQRCPSMLQNIPHADNAPVFSIWTVRRFLKRELNWVVRAGTKASQNLSISWIDDCQKAFFRLAYTISMEDIHISMVINADQTGITLIPGGSQRTYETKGVSQVLIHGKEEKRAFTLVLATSLAGTVLPVQSVWKGNTERSLPHNDIHLSQRPQAEDEGHRFVTNPRKHWSSLHTTKQWVETILVPYRLRMIQQYDLSPQAKLILYLDCWSVHRGKEFAAWVKSTHYWLIVIFVPANCTSVFQPCDVGLQRVLKHIIRQKASEFFIAEVRGQLNRGVACNLIKTTQTLTALRNETASWVRTAVKYLNTQPALVLGAWKHCKVGEYDLSYGCLSSSKTMAKLALCTDEYRSQVTGTVRPIDDVSPDAELEGEDDDWEVADDVDIPLELIQEDEMTALVVANPSRDPIALLTHARAGARNSVPTPIGPARILPEGYRRSSRIGQRGAISYEEPDGAEDEAEVEQIQS